MRERWEAQTPVARAAFNGFRGTEEDAVYEYALTGGGAMLTMAVDRGGYLARVLVPLERLIFFVDLVPTEPPKVDARVYLDGGAALDINLATLLLVRPGLWSAKFVYHGVGARGVFGQLAIKEIVLLDDVDENPQLLRVKNTMGSEIWPEFGHKK